MKATCRLLRPVSSPAGVAPAEETPSPALPVRNKGHRGSTRPSELAMVDPGSGRVVARVPVAAVDLGKLEVVSELRTGDGPDGMARFGAP